jgi:hypothetical protein
MEAGRPVRRLLKMIIRGRNDPFNGSSPNVDSVTGTEAKND